MTTNALEQDTATPVVAPAESSAGRGLTGVLLIVVFVYLAVLLVGMLVLHVNPSMDLFFVAAGFLAVALGRGRPSSATGHRSP